METRSKAMTALRAVLSLMLLLVLGPISPATGGQSDPAACVIGIERAREFLAGRAEDRGLQAVLAHRLAVCGANVEALVWYESIVRGSPADLQAWYGLGEAEARAGMFRRAQRAFGRVLELDPNNAGGELGLARADTKLGDWNDALRLYNTVLAQAPGNLDAKEGKAFLLYWTGRLPEARALFAEIVHTSPRDRESREALDSIIRGMDHSRWAAMRPPMNAPVQAWLGYETSYLADHPSDPAALSRLATAEARLRLYARAIHADQTALKAEPNDAEARQQMAVVLAWSHQYAAAIRVDRDLLRNHPGNRAALAHLAQTDSWAGNWKDALAASEALLAAKPGSVEARLNIARAEIRLRNPRAADATLGAILHQHPNNRKAHLARAQLELKGGHLAAALGDYNAVLAKDFTDPDACYGAARIYFYLNQPQRAEPLAIRAASERPGDVDYLLLESRIELALDHWRSARAALRRASVLAPSSAEVLKVKDQMRPRRRVTIETTSSYARETATQDPFTSASGRYSPGRNVEDLNTYGSSIRTGFSFLPRSSSYVLLASTPSNSPVGGIKGTVAPAEALYGQTTRLSKFLTLRGGIGIARLGPGELPTGVLPYNPVQAVPARALAAVGYVGYSIMPSSALSFDFSTSRAVNADTPVSVRLGVMETRARAEIDYAIDARTHVAASFDHIVDSSPNFYDTYYPFGVAIFRNGRDVGNEGRLRFDHNLIQDERFSLDAGYSGLAFGFRSRYPGTWMGFFNPRFYQRHFATIRVEERLFGRLRLGFRGGAGMQQVEESAPFTRAFRLSPSLGVRVSRRLGFTLGYTHYDFSQALGTVQGDALSVETRWIF